MNNVVRVSGEQPRDSATHKHVSILLQISLPSRAPHNTEQRAPYATQSCEDCGFDGSWVSLLCSPH